VTLLLQSSQTAGSDAAPVTTLFGTYRNDSDSCMRSVALYCGPRVASRSGPCRVALLFWVLFAELETPIFQIHKMIFDVQMFTCAWVACQVC
jgi:hypothetical protein